MIDNYYLYIAHSLTSIPPFYGESFDLGQRSQLRFWVWVQGPCLLQLKAQQACDVVVVVDLLGPGEPCWSAVSADCATNWVKVPAIKRVQNMSNH